MHDTAFALGRAFFAIYLADRAAEILEIGSRNVNGGLRQAAPADARFTGVDVQAGPGVDVVLGDAYALPFAADSYDAVVSSSCLEHVAMFWLVFLEMARVTRPGGYIYANAPSNGEYHRFPIDSWRFYPDAGLSLAAWARRQGHRIELAESFIARRGVGGWNDCVMVFAKDPQPGRLPSRGLADAFPGSYNIRRFGTDAIENLSPGTEDMMLLAEARQWLPLRLARRAKRAVCRRR
jgi:SAM-dependent methyltransferase